MVAVALAATSLAACGSSRESSASGDCDPGITDTTIRLGQSSAQTGPIANLDGLTVAQRRFAAINEDGGAEFGDGARRKVELVSLDDAYDPARSVVNVKRLVEQERVFSLFGNSGTSTILGSIDYLEEHKVPLVLYGSGSVELQQRYERGEITVLAMAMIPSTGFEIKTIFDGVVENDPAAKIAVLYPNDGLGKSTVELFRKYATESSSAQIVAEEAYELTAPSVDSQMTALRESGANAFVHLGAGTFVSGALKKMNELGWRPQKWVISSSTDARSVIAPAGEGAGQDLHGLAWMYGVGPGQNEDVPAVQKWREWAESEDQDSTSWAGAITYTNIDVLLEVLKRMKGCTRQDLLDAAKATTDVTGGLALPGITFGMTENDPSMVSSVVRMTYENGSWVYGATVSGR
ncbi:ABC transporter substrate-binding protein [Nocardioides sp. LHD-245]|uniref:ABC transporter substrate-binding protein n=1 Tax=Nocardioides sp. LHD-245 TaxID=3051387 RepID=UPI0027E144C9|nr:ABC transporter substrate-binding protein [Nocardioides sp. LHD-245]